MQGFKEPALHVRLAAAGNAKAKSLEALKNRPKPSEAYLAERAERARAKEAAIAERSAAIKVVREVEKRGLAQAAHVAAEAAVAAEQALADAEAARPHVPTEAELKAARDARYAARKARRR